MTCFQAKSQKPCGLPYDYSIASGLLYKNWVTDQEKVGAPRSGASVQDVGKENSVMLFKSIIVIMFTLPSGWVLGLLPFWLVNSSFVSRDQGIGCISPVPVIVLATTSTYFLFVGWGLAGLHWAQLGLAPKRELDPDMFPELCEFGFWHLQPKSSDEYKKAQTQVEPKKRKQQEWGQRGEGKRLSDTSRTPRVLALEALHIWFWAS